ncbi:BZ3500_MvSof-1268-A1-R1_Chr5-3g08281 [Microbotryum saponariae]|uniref:BZ3500_MvSof-1268-A1-R1_Chr5-3g08281 protein n=1 Tax=Microbotryum saponariae TaxID=289078 RepID=A0A2X0LR02_9BASI|nr:BZ3500_MvSof-1268-A1-R1_Chr5-3g08281 [Microbotryum saponariae]SDA08389.1 BZ3501_MvSof-1269-A2-R1_Chr5-3g08009 [Microbotryum saponariae]
MHTPVIPRITTSPASNKDTDSTSALSEVQFGSEDPAPKLLEEKEAQEGSITGTAPSHEEDRTPGDKDTPASNGGDVQATARMTPRTTKSPEDSPTDQLTPTVRSARPTVSTTTRVTTTRMLHHRGYSLDLPSGNDAPGGSSTISEGFVSPSGSMRSRRTWAAGETYEARRLERNLSALSFQSAATASPLDFHDLVQIYEIVASRRAAFDNLLWSVPSTSFAGKSVEQQAVDQTETQASFLFQIALGGDSSRSARIISMCLSILISFLTLQLFTRQLQAEAADHAWLEDWEMRHNVTPSDRAHGETWRGYREILPVRAGIYAPLAKFRGFSLWSHGMVVIGMVAVGGKFIKGLDWVQFAGGKEHGLERF